MGLLDLLQARASMLGRAGDWLDERRKAIAANNAQLMSDPMALLQRFGAETRQDLLARSQAMMDSPLGSPEAQAAVMPAAFMAHTVYHGSPHTFDKFDASKIGTGEGAQAYGHGIYLAENPGVAQGYRERLKDRVNMDEYWSKVNLPPALSRTEWDELGTLGQEMRRAHNLPSDKMSRWRELNDKSTAYSDAVKANEPKGSTYKVDLPDEWLPKMLDWDKPLRAQSQEVKDALNAAQLQGKYVTGAMGERRYQQPLEWDKTGAANLDVLRTLLGQGGKAEETLRNAGIPGIRYLDGGSRSAGEGSYNYVVFPGMEGLLKILERQ